LQYLDFRNEITLNFTIRTEAPLGLGDDQTFNGMSVYKLDDYGMIIEHRINDDAQKAVDELLKSLGLEKFRDQQERRFRTAQFFDAFQVFPNPMKALGKMFSGDDSVRKELQPGDLIYSPKDNREHLVWGIQDDVVMGGQSKSEFNEDGTWSGELITEGGGFASVRTKLVEPALDASSCEGLRLRVSGNGRRFKFVVRDNDAYFDGELNGVGWCHSFDTAADGITEVMVPFTDFVPTRFLRIVTGPLRPADLDKSRLSTFQVLYSQQEYDDDLNPNFEEGHFSIRIESIETY